MTDRVVTVGRPLLPDAREIASLMEEAISAGWLANNGILHQRLEGALAPYFGTGATRLTSSGTTALMMALQLGDLPPGAEVITSPISFAATVQAIAWCGFKPVFADVDPRTLTLCPRAVEAAVTENTAAILPVHFLGLPCDVDGLAAVAARHDVWLAYDAAHAFGLTYRGRAIAEWGDASAFSLHATKLMHTGEGGALVTPNAHSSKVAQLRNFGLQGGRMTGPGTNGKLSEAQAAVGLSVLAQIEGEITARHRLRALYDRGMHRVDHVTPLATPEGASDGLVFYGLRCDAGLRERIVTELARAKIFARDHFPLLCGPGTAYPDARIATAGDLMAPDLAPQILCLPFHGDVTDQDVARIIDIIGACAARHG